MSEMHTIEKKSEKLRLTADNGLVFCDNPGRDSSIGERYHIREKAGKLGADAVLFHRKYNERNEITDSRPVLYLYRKEDHFCNSQEHKDLHAEIRSAGDIEVYFIVSETRIDIFDARKPAEVENDTELRLDSLCLASEALKQFNARHVSAIGFGKGIFGAADILNKQANEKDAPFHRLLEYLLVARQQLKAESNGLSAETIDKLLIICIFVKFLEEIRDKDTHILTPIFEPHGIHNFADALEKGKCIYILDEIGSRFHGNLFDKFSVEEKQQIEKADLKLVAAFLNAKLDITKKHKQRFLWEQYNFKFLPIELISAVYENFLRNENNIREKNIVYTPPLLVNFLIDEVMPLDKAKAYFSKEEFKVFDPSCGSGIFLVAAYKRMLEWWSVNHSDEETRKIRLPDQQVCRKILENNIFGVDIHPTAALITVFSLTIALLSKLEPEEIRNTLKLNRLQENIRTQNFFEWAAAAKTEGRQFDLLIGSPPFYSDAKTKDSVSDADTQQFGIGAGDISGRNFALKFFEEAIRFGRKTCLILPSNALLYGKKSRPYRMGMFKKFTAEKIFDFSHLRETLFIKKIPKYSDNKKIGKISVCAIIANPEESTGKSIEHTIMKPTVSSEKKICFETDHYDRHFVRHEWATDETKKFIWKTDLLGGGRLFHLIDRLSLLPTVRDFIDSKNNWKSSGGFEDGATLISENQDRIIGIAENGEPIIERNVDICSGRLKDPVLYKPPFMIIDRVFGQNSLSVCFVSENNPYTPKSHLYYNRNFIGIRVPQEDENALKELYEYIRSMKADNYLNYQIFAVCISSNCLIGQETTVRKEDILSLPYSSGHQEYLQLSDAEKIVQDDVSEYYLYSGNAVSAKEAWQKLREKVNSEQLEAFGKTFCDALNPIYAAHGKSWQCGKFYQTEFFTICQFVYGKNQELSFQRMDEPDDVIEPLLYHHTSACGAIFTRVCRYYKHLSGYDCIFFIKPNAVRYWLESIALRDADETFI